MPRRRSATLLPVLLVCSAICVSACASGDPPRPTTDVHGGVSADVLDELQKTVSQFNAQVGSVDGQQRVLRELVDPGQAAVQSRCPPATSTLEFQPVWSAAAPASSWTATEGNLTGAVYSVPTLIRIHRASRITGTDLADLHLAIAAGTGGAARLTALCIG